MADPAYLELIALTYIDALLTADDSKVSFTKDVKRAHLMVLPGGPQVWQMTEGADTIRADIRRERLTACCDLRVTVDAERSTVVALWESAMDYDGARAITIMDRFVIRDGMIAELEIVSIPQGQPFARVPHQGWPEAERMSDEDHHDHDGHSHAEWHTTPPPDIQLRIKAMESLLVEMGVIDPAMLDGIVDFYERQVGPRNGARIVARAWADPEYKERLLADAAGAVAELSMPGISGDHVVMVENTPEIHNMIVCTLCSCYPWQTMGLPPIWFKSAAYRSRAVSHPRDVLKEFGVDLPATTAIKVWDSTADTRYMILPMRPVGTEGLTEDQLADLVTRDSMIGAGLPLEPTP